MQQVLQAVEAFKRGGLLCLHDDSSDDGQVGQAILVANAKGITAEIVNKMICNNGSCVFVTMTAERAETLGLRSMEVVASNLQGAKRVPSRLHMYNSVEAREGVGTGIGAIDRAVTINALAAEDITPRKLVSPGHVFPVEVKGGVLIRNSLAEGAHEVVNESGTSQLAAFSDLLNSDGECYSLEDLAGHCSKQAVPLLSLSQLVHFKLRSQKIIARVAQAKLPTLLAGEMEAYIYRSTFDDGEHLAVTRGKIDPNETVLVRVQTEYTFSDVFGGVTPPTRALMRGALAMIGDEKRGICIYLRHTIAGKLAQQINSWENAFKQNPATMLREYGVGAQILLDLGARKIELLTNNPRRFVGLEQFGIEIVGYRPIQIEEGKQA